MLFVDKGRVHQVVFGIIDILGCVLCGLVIAWLAYRIKQVPGRDVEFHVMSAVLMFALLILAYGLTFFKFGNTRYFGIPIIAATASLGSLSYVVLSLLFSLVRSGPATVGENGVYFYLIMFAVMCLTTLIVLTLTRFIIGLPFVVAYRLFSRQNN